MNGRPNVSLIHVRACKNIAFRKLKAGSVSILYLYSGSTQRQSTLRLMTVVNKQNFEPNENPIPPLATALTSMGREKGGASGAATAQPAVKSPRRSRFKLFRTSPPRGKGPPVSPQKAVNLTDKKGECDVDEFKGATTTTTTSESHRGQDDTPPSLPPTRKPEGTPGSNELIYASTAEVLGEAGEETIHLTTINPFSRLL